MQEDGVTVLDEATVTDEGGFAYFKDQCNIDGSPKDYGTSYKLDDGDTLGFRDLEHFIIPPGCVEDTWRHCVGLCVRVCMGGVLNISGVSTHTHVLYC